MAATPQPGQGPTRLISHFLNRDRNNQSSGWAELWDTNQSDFWDRGKPSPALIDWIELQPDALRSTFDRRLKALVPGCGKGYDVAMLAMHGFDVYGLDVSQKGIETARAYVAAELKEPSPYNFATAGNDDLSEDSVGSIKFIQSDFFQRDWEKEVAKEGFEGFDLIYDYTFLCALPPEMRKDWARRMSELLAPSGVLACLEFPLYKDPGAPGPPWGLKGVHWNILAEGGDGIPDEESASETRPLKGSFDRVVYFQPPRSYENGKGTDMFSCWKLK
ncbi:S-adenosyl-L-methionine-dependent methyltransferase [Hypoxylon cercidicola]|nr:S-adenosyl-L-methionine-dependent methyltransferase [Hypoxylon cercidicola]